MHEGHVYDGPIIDTHHHLWAVRHYPWLTAPPSPKIFGAEYELLRRDYLIGDWRGDIAGANVVASAHVQAHYDPPDHVGETRWLQGVADAHGYPHAIVGHADLAADNVEAVLDGHMAFAGFRGIRDVVTHNPAKKAWQAVDRPDYCLSRDFRRGLDALQARGLHFELQGFANQFGHFAELLADYPDLRVCLVHAGLLTGDDDATFDAWHEAITPLAGFANLHVKCSGANNVNWGPPRPAASVARQYTALIDLFGAERCFFGSNFPVEKLKSTYAGLIAMCKAAIAQRSAAEQRAFFHDSAARFYRIEQETRA